MSVADHTASTSDADRLRRAGVLPTPGTVCPRCGVSSVTGERTPNCALDGWEVHELWCAESNYADDLCASCAPPLNPTEGEAVTDLDPGTIRDLREEVESQTARAEQAEAERDEWEAAYRRVDGAYSRARNERDMWQAKFEQTDNLLSRTRDERDKCAIEAERRAARHAALREDVGARGPFGFPLWERVAILDRDDERAKGERS